MNSMRLLNENEDGDGGDDDAHDQMNVDDVDLVTLVADSNDVAVQVILISYLHTIHSHHFCAFVPTLFYDGYGSYLLDDVDSMT